MLKSAFTEISRVERTPRSTLDLTHSSVRNYSLDCAVLAGLLIVLVECGYAQEPPLEWGSVSTEDLAMKVYGADSSADALVIADYGQSSINDELGVDYERQLRVKIFRESAFDRWGTIIVALWTGDNAERLEKLEGITYSLGSDGQIVKKELSDDAIFKEKADENTTRYRAGMPALKQGCIVDVRYKIRQHSPLVMPTWKFQYSIPCRWSEYRVLYPRQMVYALVTTSYDSFFIDEQKDVSHLFRGQTAAYLGSGISLTHCQRFRLAMHNLPAISEEPYITTMDDYTPKVQLQLAAWAMQGGGIKRVMRAWENVIEELLDHKEFGKKLDPDGTVRDLSEKLTGGLQIPLARMTALYDYVRMSIVWDRKERVFCTSDLDDVIAAKKGNSAEINFLLIGLLAGAGIETHPVILSTRKHGAITDVYPLVDQFNAVIAMANIGGTTYFLDATDPDRTFDILPTSVLNVRGLLVMPGAVQWVTLMSPQRAIHRAQARVSLDSDGVIQGTLESVDESYQALQHRHAFREQKPLDAARALFSASSAGLLIDSASVTGQDSASGEIHVTAHVASSPYAQTGGDFLYVNPAVIDRVTSNPFKRPTRTFPVDMAYTMSSTSVSVIRIPEGFEVKEIPSNTVARVGTNDLVFTRAFAQEGDSITTVSRIAVNKTVFSPKSYLSLKEFYDRVVTSNSTLIVLKRKPAPPPPSASKKKLPSPPAKGAKK